MRVFYLFHRFQQGYEYSFYLCRQTHTKYTKNVWIKKTEDYGDEPPDGGGV